MGPITMVQITYLEALIVLAAVLILGFGLGVRVAAWWRERREASAWPDRTTRDGDEARWREGCAADGAWRGGHGR